MGFLSGLIGIVEGVTGIDVPFIGPGDRFFSGGVQPTVTTSNVIVRRASGGVVAGNCGPGRRRTSLGNCVRDVTSGAAAFSGSDPGAGLGAPRSGPLAAVQRFLPGGATGRFEMGEVVMGAFGLPAAVPAQVGSITRNDGSVGPILRCIAGMVLAKDNLCYPKGVKGLAAFRKWKPLAGGFLPRKDVRCLRRAIAIKKSKTNRAMLRELGLG